MCEWTDAIDKAAVGFYMAQSQWWDHSLSNEEELIGLSRMDEPTGAIFFSFQLFCERDYMNRL